MATALTQCAPTTGSITSDIDAQDRMTRYGTCTCAYTANGELTRRIDTAANAVTTYAYDEFANFRRVTQPNSTQIDYDIDGLNRRIGKRINGQVTQIWLYKDQLNPIAEFDGNGNLVSVFAYAERGHVPSLMLKAGVTYKIVSDHLGSVRQVIDLTTGAIAQALDYDAWGNVLEYVVLVPFPFTDQSGSKKRPAVGVSSDRYQRECPDLILMPITSQNPGSTRFGDVPVSDTQTAGLILPGVIKPILLTVEAKLVIKTLGRLNDDDQRAVRHTVAQLIG